MQGRRQLFIMHIASHRAHRLSGPVRYPPTSTCLATHGASTTAAHHRDRRAGIFPLSMRSTRCFVMRVFVEKLHGSTRALHLLANPTLRNLPHANIPGSTTHTPLKFLLKPQTRPSAFGYSMNGWLPQLLHRSPVPCHPMGDKRPAVLGQ